MAKFTMRKKPKFTYAISGIVTLVLMFLVGSSVLNAIASAINGTANVFASALSLLGFGVSGSTPDGTVSATGLIGVIGLVAAAAIILTFVKVSW